jgi:hypothetical protein
MGLALICETFFGTGTAFSPALAMAGADAEEAELVGATGSFSATGTGADGGAGLEAGAADGGC